MPNEHIPQLPNNIHPQGQHHLDSDQQSPELAKASQDEPELFPTDTGEIVSDTSTQIVQALTPISCEFDADELAALQTLQAKYDDLCTNALLVADGHFTGLYVYGPGGVGKSHQIRQTLDTNHKPYALVNTHVTGAKFFHKLAANPQGLFLVEDLETLFSDKIARNAMRAALWGERDAQGRMIRHVHYQTMKEDIEFDFDGRLIFTMNRPLKDIPELAALASRILVTLFKPLREELLAIAKKIAAGGYRTDKGTLSSQHALEVYYFFKEQMDRDTDRLPNLRLLVKGFAYRLAANLPTYRDSPLTWQESFRAQLEQTQETIVQDRKAKIEKEELLALELYAKKELGEINGKEMLAMFTRETGNSSSTFYIRLRSAQAHAVSS